MIELLVLPSLIVLVCRESSLCLYGLTTTPPLQHAKCQFCQLNNTTGTVVCHNLHQTPLYSTIVRAFQVYWKNLLLAVDTSTTTILRMILRRGRGLLYTVCNQSQQRSFREQFFRQNCDIKELSCTEYDTGIQFYRLFVDGIIYWIIIWVCLVVYVQNG